MDIFWDSFISHPNRFNQLQIYNLKGVDLEF